MCEVRVLSMGLIGGKPLNSLLLVLISIADRSSLLLISYVLMSTNRDGTDRVLIGSIMVCRCMWQWEVSRRMERRSRMMHMDGWGLLCISGLLRIRGMK